MAEAWGTLVIVAPQEILSDMHGNEDYVSWEAMARLFAHAGIPKYRGIGEGSCFNHEGIELHEDHLLISSFGDDWMYVLQDLLKTGKSIQVYGYVNHEHGGTELYALTASGERMIGEIDSEDPNAEEDDADINARWLAMIPARFRQQFENLDSDGDDD